MLRDRRMMIVVRGNTRTWSFDFVDDLRNLAEWRADGLEVYEIANTFPAWIAAVGLVRPWCFVQDILNFKNPLGGKRAL